jgi:hypothetical protein
VRVSRFRTAFFPANGSEKLDFCETNPAKRSKQRKTDGTAEPNPGSGNYGDAGRPLKIGPNLPINHTSHG